MSTCASDFWRRHQDADDLVPDPHENKTVPGIMTRLCLNHYTYKSYGAQFLDNLAPGIPDPLALDPSLPFEIVELLKWHDGLDDPGEPHVMIIQEYQLLSYEESCDLAARLHSEWGINDIVSGRRETNN